MCALQCLSIGWQEFVTTIVRHKSLEREKVVPPHFTLPERLLLTACQCAFLILNTNIVHWTEKFDTPHILRTKTQKCNLNFVSIGSFCNTAGQLKQMEICAVFKNNFSLIIFMLWIYYLSKSGLSYNCSDFLNDISTGL